jgi:hypothetical protein
MSAAFHSSENTAVCRYGFYGMIQVKPTNCEGFRKTVSFCKADPVSRGTDCGEIHKKNKIKKKRAKTKRVLKQVCGLGFLSDA